MNPPELFSLHVIHIVHKVPLLQLPGFSCDPGQRMLKLPVGIILTSSWSSRSYSPTRRSAIAQERKNALVSQKSMREKYTKLVLSSYLWQMR